MKSNSLIVQK